MLRPRSGKHLIQLVYWLENRHDSKPPREQNNSAGKESSLLAHFLASAGGRGPHFSISSWANDGIAVM